MLDLKTGEIVTKGGRLGPSLTRAALMAGFEPEPLAGPDLLRVRTKLSTGETVVINVSLAGEKVTRLCLFFDEKAFAKAWDMDTERARKVRHDGWLRAQGVGPNKRCPWGELASTLSERDVSAAIYLTYVSFSPRPVVEVYDKAKYHLISGFPKGLPEEAAFIPTGLFFAFLLDSGLAAADAVAPKSLKAFKARKLTGPALFARELDGALAREHLTEEGNAFTLDYFGEDFAEGRYRKDFKTVLAQGLKSVYHVPDDWKSYDALKAVLSERLQDWRKKQCSE